MPIFSAANMGGNVMLSWGLGPERTWKEELHLVGRCLSQVQPQQQPPDSPARAVSGFKAASPARAKVMYLLQNPSAQEGQGGLSEETRKRGDEGFEGDEEAGTTCWRSWLRTRPAESRAVI